MNKKQAETKKPPLGVTPLHIHESRRAEELLEVMQRYANDDRAIQPEWLKEFIEINYRTAQSLMFRNETKIVRLCKERDKAREERDMARREIIALRKTAIRIKQELSILHGINELTSKLERKEYEKSKQEQEKRDQNDIWISIERSNKTHRESNDF